MAKGYRPVRRDQSFLLPPDMRDWLPADHQVWLLIEVVTDHLDTTAFHAGRRIGGAGAAGYDPDMLVMLLIWAYAQGVRSSRRIERLCAQDVAFRIICAGNQPDHSTIARFRAEFADAVTELFTQVLLLCARLGMGALSTITLDGTKVVANAAKGANRQQERLHQLAAEAVAEHAATDAEQDLLGGPDAHPDTVPAHLQPDPDDPEDNNDNNDGGSGPGGAGESAARRRGRADRAARIAKAWETVQAQAAERAKRRRADEAAAAEYVQAAVAGTAGPGKPPASARVHAAQARLARMQQAQRDKIEAWNARAAHAHATAAPRPTGCAPLPVDEHAGVRQAREQLHRAEQAELQRAARDAVRANATPPVANLTDPDSRLMPTRNGFAQAYNAQSVLCADGLILATKLTQTPADVTWFQPMARAAEHAATLITTTHRDHAAAHHLPCTCPTSPPAAQAQTDPVDVNTHPHQPRCRHHPDSIGIMIGDAGYLSIDNLTAAGPDRLIAIGKHRDLLAAATTPDHPDEQPPPPNDPIAQMAHRLRTPEGITTYNQRGHIAETPHGHIKHNLGFRQFSMRGLTKTAAEWTFTCTVANLLKALPLAANLPSPQPS